MLCKGIIAHFPLPMVTAPLLWKEWDYDESDDEFPWPLGLCTEKTTTIDIIEGRKGGKEAIDKLLNRHQEAIDRQLEQKILVSRKAQGKGVDISSTITNNN